MRGPSQRGARFGAIGQIGLRPALRLTINEMIIGHTTKQSFVHKNTKTREGF